MAGEMSGDTASIGGQMGGSTSAKPPVTSSTTATPTVESCNGKPMMERYKKFAGKMAKHAKKGV